MQIAAHSAPCPLLSPPTHPPPTHPTHPQGQPLRPLLEAEAQGLSKGFLGRGVDLPAIAAKGYDDVNVVHGVFGSACYIEDSFPSMLYLAWRHAGERAVQAG